MVAENSYKSGKWDFGLTQKEEERAALLHRDSIIIDLMHQHPGGSNIYQEYDKEIIADRLKGLKSGYEGLAQAVFLPYQLAIEGVSHRIKDWWDMSGITLGTRNFILGPDSSAKRVRDEWENIFTNLPWLQLVTTAKEIRQAKLDGVHAVYGYCQPTSGLSNNLKDIDLAYNDGLRMLMLTYNRMDYVGTGCTERVDAGLSMYGVDVVRRCNELGIIVDTSHCGKQTTLDACAYSKAPVFANHACAKGVYAHARGKTDEEFEAIAKTGGVIGVVAVPFFLSSAANASIEAMLDHIDYIVSKVGWQHVAIGSDWPMQGPKDAMEKALGPIIEDIGFRPEDNVSPISELQGFADYRDMPNVTRGLIKRGYTDEQIRGILGENVLSVFERVCG